MEEEGEGGGRGVVGHGESVVCVKGWFAKGARVRVELGCDRVRRQIGHYMRTYMHPIYQDLSYDRSHTQ